MELSVEGDRIDVVGWKISFPRAPDAYDLIQLQSTGQYHLCLYQGLRVKTLHFMYLLS
jgi:hypothetical protein